MSNLLALPGGTKLVGDYRIKSVLGSGGFGITYLADELALGREVTIKEYFPADFAARDGGNDAAPRSKDCAGDYKWGLDRFIEEAQTLARFDHPNIVRVFRYFEARNTAYMVLKFEQGQSLKGWLKSLGRAPRQAEIDQIVAPLLDALDVIHRGDYLHRDIAPDNIMIRADRTPVLIDFGSARGEIASHSRTVSALVKPGYSPYEQYASTTSQQGPWTDIYSLGATLYQAIAGKRPPDAPSRVVKDDYVPARDAALSSYRPRFLAAIDKALRLEIRERPQSIAEWRGELLAPPERARTSKIGAALGLKRDAAKPRPEPPAPEAAAAPQQPQPDAPQSKGRLLEFVEQLKGRPAPERIVVPVSMPAAPAVPRFGLGFGPAPGDGQPVSAPLPPVEPIDRPPPRVLVAPVERRRPARRWPVWLFFLRSPWRGYAFKLAIGCGVAGLAVALSDSVPRIESRGSATIDSQRGDVVAALPMTGHRSAVIASGLARSGRSLVTIGADGAIRLADPGSGAHQRTIALDPAVKPTSAVVDDRFALIASPTGALLAYDLDRPDAAAPLRLAGPMTGPVTALAVVRDGAPYVAVLARTTLALIDRTAPAAPTAVAEGHTGEIAAIAALPARNAVASAGDDRTVRLWSADGLSPVRTYRGHTSAVTAVAAPPDGRAIASGSSEGAIRIWSAASTRLIRSFKGHGAAVTALAFPASGDLYASASADGAIKVWDLKRSKPIATIERDRRSLVRTLAFSADGRRVFAGADDGSVTAYEIASVKVARD